MKKSELPDLIESVDSQIVEGFQKRLKKDSLLYRLFEYNHRMVSERKSFEPKKAVYLLYSEQEISSENYRKYYLNLMNNLTALFKKFSQYMRDVQDPARTAATELLQPHV